MNLLVGQLKIRIRELLEERGIDASVVDKTNAKGELVIAIILNEACPACGGSGKRVYARAVTDAATTPTPAPAAFGEEPIRSR